MLKQYFHFLEDIKMSNLTMFANVIFFFIFEMKNLKRNSYNNIYLYVYKIKKLGIFAKPEPFCKCNF